MVSSGEIVREHCGHVRLCCSIVGPPPENGRRREDSTEFLLAQYSAVLNASRAARCVACQGVRVRAVPVAHVGQCLVAPNFFFQRRNTGIRFPQGRGEEAGWRINLDAPVRRRQRLATEQRVHRCSPSVAPAAGPSRDHYGQASRASPMESGLEDRRWTPHGDERRSRTA